MAQYHGQLYQWGIKGWANRQADLSALWYQQIEQNPRFRPVRQIITKTVDSEEQQTDDNIKPQVVGDADIQDEKDHTITDEEYLRSRRYWRQYVYHSPEALTNGDRLIELKKERPIKKDGSFKDFRYHILFRVNSKTGTVIMLSETNNIVGDLVREALKPILSPQLMSVQLNIEGLAKNVMFQNPDEYELTLLSCWIAESGTNLHKISFEGDDLANAMIVRDHFGSFRPYFLGLSKRPENHEILRLSQKGYVRLNIDSKELLENSRLIKKINDFEVVVADSRKGLGKAEACLVYINKNGFYL